MLYFRLPFSDDFYTTDDVNTKALVSFVSFDKKQKIDFKGQLKKIEIADILAKDFTPKSKSEFVELHKETEDSYTNKIHQAIDFIEQHQLKKIVISRRKLSLYSNISTEKKLSLSHSFIKFCEAYPNAFCYLFEKDNVCWMGGFSEVLGKYNKLTNTFETMSLAGTQPVEEAWTDKELEEQKPVTDYIQSILKRFAVDIHVSKVQDHISGNIKHLRTDFTAKVYPQDVENLIKELHPTPAVCGFPKGICQQGIKIIEFVNRDFYAGYTKVETEEEIQYYVNLRCAQFFKNYAILYAGGGITPKSDPKKEWQETELKSMAIQNNLVFI